MPAAANQGPGGCSIIVSQALQTNRTKIHNIKYHTYGENFKLKLCTCAQSMALGTRTKLEILIKSMISAIHKFRENILERSRNASETTPRYDNHCYLTHWPLGDLVVIFESTIFKLIIQNSRLGAHCVTAFR